MKQYTDSIQERLTGRYKKCIEFCGDVTGKKILNIGCYNGWLESVMLEKGCKEVIGVDINDKFLELSSKNVTKARFLKASVFSLPLPDNYFDFASMFDVLEHIPQNRERGTLVELRRVLRNGGKLIISIPKANFLANLLDPAWYIGHRHYSSFYLTSLIKNLGFSITRVESSGGCYELISMILLYFFKWVLYKEIPFKKWFDKKRDGEYLEKSGFVTLFVEVTK